MQYETVENLYFIIIIVCDLATGRERQLTTESARKGPNTTSGAQFTALPLIKPVV